MIKKLAKFFCLSPLLLALTFTYLSMSGFADQVEPSTKQDQSKENSKYCIEKIKAQQKKIKQEMDLIKNLIKNRRDQNQGHNHQ
jgi:ABC-type transporter MlaC component